MPQSNTESYNSNSHDSSGNVSQTVERFVGAVEDLAVELDAPDSIVSEFVESGKDLAQLVEDTAHSVEENAEQIDDVDEQHGSNIEGCHARISKVEEKIDDRNEKEGRQTDKKGDNPKGVDDDPTALERICGLPEHVVQDNLTENQRRARSVARRIEEYGRKVPAGIAITSSRIKRVLTAQEDTTIHRQTVSRVADFLERFGDGKVKIKETRGGKTTVVFDDEIVESVTHVVTEQEDSSVTPAVV